METQVSIIESLFEQTESYGKTSYELVRLKSLEKTIVVVTALIARMSVIAMISLFIIVFNIGIAMLLGEWIGKSFNGFFIVAAFYLITGIILHFFLYQWLKKPISHFIISQALQ